MKSHNAPDGWRFYFADFSMQAEGRGNIGSVMLIRDPDEKARWHMQDESDKECANGPPLYVTGCGETLEAALSEAEIKANAALPIKPPSNAKEEG